MISSSIFTGANIFITIAICLIAAVVAVITTDMYKGIKDKEAEEKE
jgi:energy-coupling factor transporter transmembrane protein EcfT